MTKIAAVDAKKLKRVQISLTLLKELMERLEIEKESLKARLEIDERSEGVISSQSARGAPTVAALGSSFPFCSLHNLIRSKFEIVSLELRKQFFTIGSPIVYQIFIKRAYQCHAI